MVSPPVKVYSESHQRQRRLQPVRRTKTHGRPMCDDSPWMEWKISVTRIPRRVRNAGFFESLPPQDAGVAMSARLPLRAGVVAGVGERVVDAELDAFADDLRFRHAHQRRDDARLPALDSAARAGDDHALE